MRARRWALIGGMLLTAGCVTHRGPWRLDAPADAPPGGVDVVVLGSVAPHDRRSEAVAARVDEILSAERPSVVLWLGNVASAPMASATRLARRRGPRCIEPAGAWTPAGLAALVRSVRARAPARSFAVIGQYDHRCGHETSLDPPPAWHRPASHYVVRVFDDGALVPWIRCAQGHCAFDPAPRPAGRAPLVDLVVVDLSAWLHPSSDPAGRRRDERTVAALELLLSTLADTPPRAAPPRLLVSNAPAEAAAEHGLGALHADATFHNLPPQLQAMLVDGHFVGVLSGHDRSLSATTDLTDAFKRADRAWARAPVFQVSAGAVAHPNARAAMALRRPRVRRSQAWRPEVFSDHAGFAVIRLHPGEARITLHARRGRRWEATSLRAPLRPEPHPAMTSSPHMGPCRDCPAIPATER